MIQEAEYPQHFDLNKFKTLKSFKERVDYCNQTLQKLGTGSSRIVYLIDNKTVLKLAKNQKGIAQNETEINSSDSYFNTVIAEVFEYDPQFLWVEMEYAKPATKNDFKNILGYTVDDFGKWIRNQESINNGRRAIFGLDKNLEEQINESEFANGVLEFILNYGLSSGDLGSVSSYGVRDSEIVIIDYGINDDVLDTYYRKMREELEKVKNYNQNLLESDVLDEAVYKGKKVPLYKLLRGDVSKFKVYINSGNKDSEGSVIAKKINFGHGGTSAKARGEKTMEIKRDDLDRRRAFRSRFRCDSAEAKDKDTKRYWNCKTWGNKSITDLMKEQIKEIVKTELNNQK